MEFVGKDTVQTSSNPSIKHLKYEGLLQMLDIRRDMMLQCQLEYVNAAAHKFSRNLEATSKSWHQKGGKKQVPY